MDKYLVITAHPDDAEITMGGTIQKLVNQGHQVKNVILSIPNEAELRKAEAKQSADFLKMEVEFLDFKYPCTVEDHRIIDLVTQLDKVIEIFKPKAIFTHSIEDSHQDHRIVSQAAQTCFRKHACDMYSFEQINQSNLIYSNKFTPDVYVDISDYLERKIEALKIHRSQMKGYMVHYLTDVQKLAEWRGHQYGTKYAETFKTIFKREL